MGRCLIWGVGFLCERSGFGLIGPMEGLEGCDEFFDEGICNS